MNDDTEWQWLCMIPIGDDELVEVSQHRERRNVRVLIGAPDPDAEVCVLELTVEAAAVLKSALVRATKPKPPTVNPSPAPFKCGNCTSVVDYFSATLNPSGRRKCPKCNCEL